MPTDAQFAEISAAKQAARDAEDRGEESGELIDKAVALMEKYGGGAEEPGPMDDDAPAADPATIALAIATARGEGDDASAKKLEAMLGTSAQ